MDEKTINAKGLTPLKPELDRIAAIKTPQDMTSVIARLHLLAVNVLFNFSSGQDFKDSNAVIGQADQGGLGLPERDYYFRTDAKAVDTRKEYVAHLERQMVLMGVPAAEAARRAAAVMELETALAQASLDVTARRDPNKVYHLMKVGDLQSLNDSFNWNRYFTLVAAPKMDNLNVAAPDFFKSQEALLKKMPIEVWKDYLSIHLVAAQSMLLPTAFDQENFAFFSKYMRGTKEQQPRWKRCVQAADGDLGEAVGIAYVEQTFGKEGKDRMLAMVKNLEKALGDDIQKLNWMTPATKEKAMEKLHTVTNKIGYPDKWRDYSKLRIVRGDALGNSLRANEFEISRQIQKINKPVDRGEWFMTPPTVNAYYDPQMNNINFPAGILQPPFFDKNADDATNYGAIGAVIGHELTHGFDDQGRQFDPKGNLQDWWTEADAKAFEERAQCFVKEYEQFELPGGVHMNGKLTLGENTADNGGLRVAMMALMDSLAAKALGTKDGFTPEQRFFLGWGQVWCQNQTPEVQRLQAQTNPHSISRFRVNGVVQNMPEFSNAFGCKAGQPMVKGADACRVW
jgi:putative endopeptidase